nr:MAG TPA: hypothetical protein [Microviridae sp.]
MPCYGVSYIQARKEFIMLPTFQQLNRMICVYTLNALLWRKLYTS